ncbi:Importin subunit alpha-1 [Caenorhabditis elegans]|uniref:Importin subunit alpha-1 n=1 Tax=Caenorhabditis elegans TaxID=6239 RepID=IMA1_CAEEL|nr:Importin subunit alpha-1 [Caenorhabditis elegans]Q22560.1 RecName: Full=Importin subunit alpha-1; AltName: Full=Karyopherin subunit alpha-1 [Caenorhabditis elegans]CAA98540.1 Importin subunit alpha-1 [Caenorhabditis elegans]|eukprot:NP_505854.1 Importin subunit alpha-1 [Caenorhabditis elegans]
MGDEFRPSHEERSKMYKSNVRDQNEMRRKRREDEVQIRKNRRDEKFERNRQITVQRSLSHEETSELLKSVADGLQSMQETTIHEALTVLHENLNNTVWTIHVLVKVQILHKLSDVYCNRVISQTTRLLISRTLLKISGIDEVKYERYSSDDRCIQSLVFNISTYGSSEDILCDTFQSIACFIIRSITYRNLALDCAIVSELIDASTINMSIILHRSLMWLVFLFCEKLDRCSPHVDEIAPLLEIISNGIQSTDAMVQTDAASSCASLAEWPPIYHYMSDLKLCSKLVANLRNDKGNARPKVKAGINSIIQATGYFTEEMIDAGLLEVLKGFVNVSYMSQEVCFIISNICVEGEQTIDKLISSGVLREVARVMEASEYRSRREAAFVICHCCASANQKHLEYVVELGMLSAFTDLLTCMDVSLVSYILDAIYLLLQFGEMRLLPDNSNPVAIKLEEIGCREKLEFLCESQSVDIHARAYTIIDRFYVDDDAPLNDDPFAGYQRNNIDDTIEKMIREPIMDQPFSF